MPRAATKQESLPPLIPASPAVAAAVEAYLAAKDRADELEQREGFTVGWQAAVNDQARAWSALEDLCLGLPRAWHLYGGVAWGLQKVSKCGWQLVRRDPATIRQAPTTDHS